MPRARLRRFFRHGFLPQLMAFEAVVRLGSVTRAAEELSLAQPTVSCMLRKLSETLGGPVTVIRERRVEPSELGRELLVLCSEMFRAMEAFEAGYDRSAETDPRPPAWLSSYRPRNPSRWRQRATQCPRAKRRPASTDGAS